MIDKYEYLTPFVLTIAKSLQSVNIAVLCNHNLVMNNFHPV